MTHECPHPHCPKQVPDHMFACGPHWYALNRDLRNRIWRAWNAGRRAEHAAAMAEAIQVYEGQAATGRRP